MRDIYSKIDELEDLLEMSRIGFTNDGYEVYINTIYSPIIWST